MKVRNLALLFLAFGSACRSPQNPLPADHPKVKYLGAVDGHLIDLGPDGEVLLSVSRVYHGYERPPLGAIVSPSSLYPPYYPAAYPSYFLWTPKGTKPLTAESFLNERGELEPSLPRTRMLLKVSDKEVAAIPRRESTSKYRFYESQIGLIAGDRQTGVNKLVAGPSHWVNLISRGDVFAAVVHQPTGYEEVVLFGPNRTPKSIYGEQKVDVMSIAEDGSIYVRTTHETIRVDANGTRTPIATASFQEADVSLGSRHWTVGYWANKTGNTMAMWDSRGKPHAIRQVCPDSTNVVTPVKRMTQGEVRANKNGFFAIELSGYDPDERDITTTVVAKTYLFQVLP